MHHTQGNAKMTVLAVLAMGCAPAALKAAVMLGWGGNTCRQLDAPTGSTWAKVVAGECYTLVLDSAGNLGVLGEGWPADAIRADIPENETFVGLHGKRNHALAQRSDGTLVGLGSDVFGQASPPPEPFVSFAAGSNHSLAIRPDGTIAAWGYGDFGQTAIPDGNDFIAVDGGEYHSLALRSDHRAFSWGWYGGEVADVSAIAAGWGHCLVLKMDGSLYAWGANVFGELDFPPGNDFVAIWAGGFTSAAMHKDGTIEVWGDIADGQNLVPEFLDRATISLGFHHGTALAPTGDCSGNPVFSAQCVDGRGKIVAKAKRATPGASLICWLDAPTGPWLELPIDVRGRGKTVFRGVAEGGHIVTVCDAAIPVTCVP